MFALFIQLLQESDDYECICIVINGKIRSVPLNILSGVVGMFILQKQGKGTFL